MVRRAEISASGFQLEASVVADTFRVSPAEVMAHIRDGRMTTRCEAGVDEDEGRHRLTFFLGNRRVRLVVDDAGRVIENAAVDFGDRPQPAALRGGA